MKSLKQLELEYYIRKKRPAYWASVVKPSCEKCLKNRDCTLLQKLDWINSSLANLEQKWDTWKIPKHIKMRMHDYIECTDSHKMIEDKRRCCKEEKQILARKLFREKAEIMDKITSCLNSRTYLAIYQDHCNFENQSSWNIGKCHDCTFYVPMHGGICTALGIYHPKSPRICKYFLFLTDEDIELRRTYRGEEIE